MNTDIYSYIKSQEALYETDKVQVGDNWDWNMRDHIQLIFHLKNGQFYGGENSQTKFLRAFKNVMEPMLNLAYWTEDIEVKDVVFFIEGDNARALSFLVKKYHDEVYVREHDLDTLFDEITESDLDYGGVIVQKAKKRPELLQLNSVAFCDQTDIMGGPIGLKFYFSPDKLRSMSSYGWGDEANGATISLDALALLGTDDKDPVGTDNEKKNKVPGKTIEVYVVRGTLPEAYLLDNDNTEDNYGQVQVVAFYTDKNKKKQGVTLYRKKDDGENLMFFSSKPIYNRALGRGVGEMLLQPQVWTNFLTIHKTQMLEAGSKVPLVTDDPTFTSKNKIQDMENLEITTIAEGSNITQIPTAAVANIQLYEKSINEWFEHAQLSGAAFDPILGKEPNSGTTFRGQERTVAQGRGLHDRRRGQRAKFIEKLYRTWIIPDIIREIVRGQEFVASLSAEEVTWIADQMANNHANQKIKESLLKGKILTQEEQDMLKTTFKEVFAKSGNKKLIKILKDEFRDVPMRMGINIAGKQKDLVNASDKLLSIFQFIFANPSGFQQAMQVPALAKSFSDILEFSGMSIADFSSMVQPPAQSSIAQQPQAQGPAPMALNPVPAEA